MARVPGSVGIAIRKYGFPEPISCIAFPAGNSVTLVVCDRRGTREERELDEPTIRGLFTC